MYQGFNPSKKLHRKVHTYINMQKYKVDWFAFSVPLDDCLLYTSDAADE